ncbi:glutathione-disulfide reductase [Rubrimonas cliftonensis]|uniref:Glutathione reductase n=1 Tax=Rubrimonas cliftonensis TaxID=89524 RepID=A0A1H3VUK5_9RHOB|nr:glutathione-disulfide reductase [Rubrimonas cliftonensis]SDZ78457.1 NADPH-glutathione reductase [Rubrimonas cliftonensis]
MAFDYDLFVIGGGSGGVRAGRLAAQGGAKVGVAEEHRFGGTCVIRGCVPKKLMVYASAFSEAFEDARGFGWSVGETSFDWPTFLQAKDREIARLESIYERNLSNAGATLHRCRATVAGPHEVALAEGGTVSARHILVATGGAPFVPDMPGRALGITSNEAFHLDRLPRKVLLVGGGYIACEFACIFHGLGVETTLVYRGDMFLKGFDNNLRAFVAESMAARGVDVRFGEDVVAIEETSDGLRAKLRSGGEASADVVFFGTGRRPNTAGLGLEDVGVALTPGGAVKVDDYSQSTVPSIYAVGDVTDRMALTPVAIREGAAFVETVFNGRPTKPDHACVATAVFTQPELGTVGLTEEQARAEGEVEIYRAIFRPMMATLSGRDEKVMMKLVVRPSDRRVLGVHIAGHAAGEMIQLAGVAVKMGATKEDFDRTVAVHPTAAEELVTMRDPVA